MGIFDKAKTEAENEAEDQQQNMGQQGGMQDGQQGGMQALGEDPDLLEHPFEVMGDLVQSRLDLGRKRESRAHRAEAKTEGEDPRLDPVMEVAFDPAPCLVASGDDPGA